MKPTKAGHWLQRAIDLNSGEEGTPPLLARAYTSAKTQLTLTKVLLFTYLPIPIHPTSLLPSRLLLFSTFRLYPSLLRPPHQTSYSHQEVLLSNHLTSF